LQTPQAHGTQKSPLNPSLPKVGTYMQAEMMTNAHFKYNIFIPNSQFPMRGKSFSRKTFASHPIPNRAKIFMHK
jgi:hypothetical protein